MKVPTASASPLALIAALAGAVCVLSLPRAATAAQPETTAPRIVVHYGDLDLTTQAGAEELYRRIAQAAHDVCPRPGRALTSLMATQACRRDALARAVDSMHNGMLAQVRAARLSHG